MVARWVVVGAYGSSLEAGLAQGILKQAGIASDLDGLTTQSWAAGDVPLTGFRLLVAQADAEEAAAVLAEFERAGPLVADEPAGDGPADAAGDAERPGATEETPASTPEAEAEPAPVPEVEADGDEEADANLGQRSLTRVAAALTLSMIVLAPLSIVAALGWAFDVRARRPVPAGRGGLRRMLPVFMLLAVVPLLVGIEVRWLEATGTHRGGTHLALGILVGYDVLLALAILAGWRGDRRT